MRDFDIPLPLARAVLDPVFRVILNDRLPFAAQRVLMDVMSRAQPVPDDTVVRRLRLAGRPAERITSAPTAIDGPRARAAESGAILYLHGGGYTVGSLTTHRSLAARLAHGTDCPVYVLDYRLAPEHPFPAALDDAETAFLELVREKGHRPERIAIAGDSAGGGLTLATAQRLVADHGLTPPRSDSSPRGATRTWFPTANAIWSSIGPGHARAPRPTSARATATIPDTRRCAVNCTACRRPTSRSTRARCSTTNA